MPKFFLENFFGLCYYGPSCGGTVTLVTLWNGGPVGPETMWGCLGVLATIMAYGAGLVMAAVIDDNEGLRAGLAETV